jgi:trigger factor
LRKIFSPVWVNIPDILERKMIEMKRIATAGCIMLLIASLITGCNTSKKAEEATTQVKAETENITVDYGKGLNEDGTLADVDDPAAYVTVCEYKGIKIKKKDITASDDDVQAQIDSLMSTFQETKEIKDRPVKEGDTVNIDFTGKIDGKEFDGGSAQGYDLTIGSHTFIDNFEDQLIGHNPGETLDVKVKFPDDYQAKDYAGKDAVFTVVINYIGEKVDAKLTDDFVKENLSSSYGYTSVKDMKKKIKDNLEKDKKSEYVWNYLMDNSTFKEIPKELMDTQLDLMVEGVKAESQTQGISYEDYLSGYGFKDEQALRDAYYETTENMIKTYLIADVIAGQENITVTEDDLKNYFDNQDYSIYLERYSESYIKRHVLNYLVAEFVIENAEIN